MENALKSKYRIVLIRSNPVSPDPPVEKMADTLLSMGHDVTILAWDRAKSYKEKNDTLTVKSQTVPIYRFGIEAGFGAGKKSFAALLKFQIKLFKWLSRHKNEYDIIHAFDYDTGSIAKICCALFKKKLVYHILDFYTQSHALDGLLAKIIARSEYNVINYADATIICTEKRKEQIRGSKPKKLVVIHNTPQSDSANADNAFTGDPNKCKIVYVGILGSSRYICEIADFVSNDDRFEFHIGGFGKDENIVKKYADENENIFYYGKLQYSQTLALEKQCDIMTAIYDPSVPNHKFAAPNKFYESLMLGKPVIMAKNTGFDEIIEDNRIGCLMDFSEKGLKDALTYLYENRTDWEKMGERARKLYNEMYSWSVMEQRITDLYNTI